MLFNRLNGKYQIMRHGALMLVLCLAGAAHSICADEIFFKNGARLTGKVEQLVDGKMVFKSDVAGTLTIDLSNIQTFNTDMPIKVHLSDGTVFSQRILKSKPWQFAMSQIPKPVLHIGSRRCKG